MTGWQIFSLHLELFGMIALGSLFMLAMREAAEVLSRRVTSRMRSVRRSTRLALEGAAVISRLDLPARTRPARSFGRFLPRQTSLTTAGVVLASALGSRAAAGDAWSSFQNGGKLAQPATSQPFEWSPSTGIAWRAEVAGTGQSSPVIWDGHVYVTSASGANKETYHVSAWALQTGEKLWRRDFANPTPQENSGYVSVAAPTPAVDAAGLVCFFEGGNVVALTHEGSPRWERNLVAEYGPIVSRHGISASVEQDETAAYLWVERETDPYLLAVNKATGDNLWKVPGIGATSWASPRLVPVGEARHLVLSAIGSLTGLDPATGHVLWKLEGITGNSTPTPVPVADGRFLIGATTGRGEATAGNSAASNGLVGIRRGEDGQWSAEYVWRAKRATSSFGSPIAFGDAAYFVNRVGVLYALDLANGEERYAERLGDSIWATPLVVGDQLLFFGKGGVTTVVASDRSFRKLADYACWTPAAPPAEKPAAEGPPAGSSGPTLYGVACADGRLILRGGSELLCIGQSSR